MNDASHLGDVFRRADGDDAAAAGPALGAQIDHPVRRLDHIQIVLDDEHGIAGLDESVQHVEQLADVFKVQPGRRLVQNIKRLARFRGGTTREPT